MQIHSLSSRVNALSFNLHLIVPADQLMVRLGAKPSHKCKENL